MDGNESIPASELALILSQRAVLLPAARVFPPGPTWRAAASHCAC